MSGLCSVSTGFPNARLIGHGNARSQLLTPALILDHDQFLANLQAMQHIANLAGVTLRPHGKAHKCPEMAHRQIAAGAVGICAATPGEAEVFARAGISDILMTSTFATRAAAERLADIAASGTRLSLVADSLVSVNLIAAALAHRKANARILIDIDTGRHRSGARSVEAARELADAILKTGNLELAGIQAYAGHLSHWEDLASRTDQAQAVGQVLEKMLEGLRPHLPQNPVVTGGSTGAFRQELALELYTELQCGSYALMDAEYDRVDPDGTGTPAFPTALFVSTAVISSNVPGRVTTDGGEKRFAAKLGTLPVLRRGAPDGATYQPSSDEHGTILLPEGTSLPAGSLVEVQVPHCDPTVNLYDALHVMRGEKLEAIWPIAARGA
ncbi:alanine racemase [Agaricicola taiwanensis]|uniref:Alanine racemase n=1 Tax=Agaricicola taiwanensis TaxID=591372 RepID=A0A8J2YN98_9RHOB|nr:alanine racemase [Agaricicola taiwanensis]GGE54155.1 alanine racemase [Agaricicola taiwanensis]